MSQIHDNVLIFDRGVYSYRAEEFARVFKNVYYYMPDSAAYPESTRDCIGADLDGVERVYDFDKYLKKCDWLYFPDCYDGEKQMALREQGYPVFGEGSAGRLEMDKEFFYEHLESVGLEVPYTYVAENFEEVVSYLDDKQDKWVKPADSYSRADWETYHWVNKNQGRRWINEIRYRLGIRCDDLRVLIQDGIKDCICEPGYDGLNVLGQYVDDVLLGYEDKDSSYLGRICFEVPKPIKTINDKMAPILKELGCQGHWTIEEKITKDGKIYFLDPTLRCPEPGGAIFDVIYENYPESCREIAHGRLPKLKYKKRYCAQIMLYSSVHEKEQICVEFPKELKPYIKLKNHTKTKNYYTIIPNDNGGYFGGVVGVGSSIKEAKENALDIFSQITAEGMSFDKSSFDRIEESISKGKAAGINF
jgi:hypothetical protein